MENRLILDGVQYVVISEKESEEFEILKHKEMLRNAVRDINKGERLGMSMAEFKEKLSSEF